MLGGERKSLKTVSLSNDLWPEDIQKDWSKVGVLSMISKPVTEIMIEN